MENKIFDANHDFDYNILNLANPSLLGKTNSYTSKFTHGKASKNVYLQLPKCTTKQGFSKTATKTFCELNFSIQEKSLIEFFENLEKYAIDKIYENKDIWFYNSDSINKEDIEDIFSPIIKPYKHGKQILIKTYIKNDKINIYDENEKKMSLDDFNEKYEIIPLINLDNIKFSNKNFSIELILTQIVVLYPTDEFENKLLIQLKDKSKNNSTEDLEKPSEKIESKTLSIDSKNLDEDNQALEESEELNKKNQALEESEELNKKNQVLEESEELNEENKELEESEELNEKNQVLEEKNQVLEEKNQVLEEKSELEETTTSIITNNNKLLEIDNLDIDDNDDVLELKSQTEIYLDIYKIAKKKAKEIRKNAINAFLEAKKIKLKYNLESLVNSDSSDDDDIENFE